MRGWLAVGAIAWLGTLFGASGCASGAEPGPTTAPPPSEARSVEPTVEATTPLEVNGGDATAAAESDDEVGHDGVVGADQTQTITLEALFALDGSHSTSFGGPNDGRLEGGVALPTVGPGFVSNPRRPNAGGYFGTVEMVQALVRAAGVVHGELGGAMAFNDLALEHGGPIWHHGSHTGGRDVDALFFYLDREGNPIPSKGIPIDPDGRGWDFGDLHDPADDVAVRLDVPRTWKFVEALVMDENATVQRIFLVEHVREMLLAHARRTRAPRAAIDFVDQMTCQPSIPHDDHMHVRFFCTPEDIRLGQCADMYPIYPWWRRKLRTAGVSPIPATNGRRQTASARAAREAAAPTTSRAEAAAQAGPMHARVRRFLAEREVWSERPHPGRTYCR